MGSNESLLKCRSLVRRAIQKALFGQIWDVLPIYTAGENVALYYSRVYSKSIYWKLRKESQRKSRKESRKIVYRPRDLPSIMNISLHDFSLHTPYDSRRRRILSRIATVLGVPIGDIRDINQALGNRRQNMAFHAAHRVQCRCMGKRIKRWTAKAIIETLLEFYPFMDQTLPAVIRYLYPEFFLGEEEYG